MPPSASTYSAVNLNGADSYCVRHVIAAADDDAAAIVVVACLHVGRRVGEKEAKVDVRQSAGGVEKNVAVVSVFDLSIPMHQHSINADCAKRKRTCKR